MKYLLGVVFILLSSGLRCQNISYTEKDQELFDQYMKSVGEKEELTFPELLIETGMFFLNTPYVASTLEKEPEQIVVNLRELDCTTFVESVLALSRTAVSGDPSFARFVRELQYIRYRNGLIEDYTSRLHYMSEWIYENEKKGIIQDITKQLGGEPYPLNLSFMSTHPGSYKQLASNPDYVIQIAEIERVMNERPFYYIPKEELDHYDFNDGDIVCFTTQIEGLDISHVGYIYTDKKRLTFIHASTSAKQVVVQPGTLAEYTQRIKSNSGVMILRPIQP